MENNKEIKKHIKKITTPIFNKVLKEVPTNPMRGKKKIISRLIQPHNHRLYFSFDKSTYNPTPPYTPKNHKSEHHFENFYGCYIVVRKKTIEIINLWHQKQWRLIEASSFNQIDERIKEIKENMDNTSIKALQKFIMVNGGGSDLIPIRRREPEIGYHGSDYIDKIPKDMIIHDTYFKKVYKEKTEVYGFGNIKNIISAEARNEFTIPEIDEKFNKSNVMLNNIVSSMKSMSDGVVALNKKTEYIAENYKSHTEVVVEIKKFLKKLNNRLSQKKLKEFI